MDNNKSQHRPPANPNPAKPVPNSNEIKNPDDWTTGDEPMTGAQHSYLHTLAAEAGEPAPVNLSKAEASKKMDELQHKTGRGLQHDNNPAE
jgi:Protein of unknown function (DUF3072)